MSTQDESPVQPNTAGEPTPGSREAPVAYEPPRILHKRSVRRVTLVSGTPNPGGPGDGIGGY